MQVQIKTPNFHTVQRQTTLRRATWLRQDIVATAMELIRQALGSYGQSIRTLTVTAGGLVPADEAAEQLDMFGESEAAERREAVEDALTEIRRKHGKQSIQLGYYDNPEIGTGQKKKPPTK